MLPMDLEMDNTTSSATLEPSELDVLQHSPTLDPLSLAWETEGKLLDEEVRRWFERNQVESARRSVMRIYSVID